MNDATIAEELVEALESNPDVAAMTWDECDYETRIFPQIRVQDDRKIKEQLPAIIYDMVPGPSEPRALDGEASLRREVWRLVCYADTYQKLDKLAKAVVTALTGYCGPGIRELIVVSQGDDYEDELNVHERQIDLSLLVWS